MKRFFFLLLSLSLISGYMLADDVKIDKNSCTITKDGKTYKLYGKVKIVDSFEDIKVKIVDCFEDVDIKIVDCFEDSCGKVKIVDCFEDVKIKIVDSFEDVKVKIVDCFEGVK
ncbi:MAG: hypothetical protein K6A36_07850 [Paludibacteraceae bacterium]|nr:hypothetical protein [Paludibacteraceae bacterium]